MKVATVELKSVSPMSQSRKIQSEKKDKELDAAFEERVWRERMHVNDDGNVYIPPMAFSNGVKDAAKYLAISVPGKGKTLFTKHFAAGVLVPEPLVLPIKAADVDGEWVFVPSDGRPGGGRRVMKCFPLIKQWAGKVTYYIMDDIITKDVFLQVLKAAGMLIGIGRFRPINRGYYGRFDVVKVDWKEQ